MFTCEFTITIIITNTTAITTVPFVHILPCVKYKK